MGTPLDDDDKPIKKYGVKEKDVLKLGTKINVYVKQGPDGKKKGPVATRSDEPVSKLKKKISKKLNIPAKQLKPLKKGDTVLRDSKPVGKYGLKEKDVLTAKPESITVIVETPS